MRRSLCAWKSSTLARLRATNVIILVFQLVSLSFIQCVCARLGVVNDPIQRVSATGGMLCGGHSPQTPNSPPRACRSTGAWAPTTVGTAPNCVFGIRAGQRRGFTWRNARPASAFPCQFSGSKRQRRIDLAQAELTAGEPKSLTVSAASQWSTRGLCRSVVSGTRIEHHVELNNIDLQTAPVVKTRVVWKATPPRSN